MVRWVDFLLAGSVLIGVGSFCCACAGPVEQSQAPAVELSHAPREGPSREVPGELVLDSSDGLQGFVRARRITVPLGVELRVSEDLHLIATDDLLVLGDIFIEDVPLGVTDAGRAASLVLRAGRRLTLLGDVQGGRGRDSSQIETQGERGLPGGDGSSIVLASPEIFVYGTVCTGTGGPGGTAADGGHGGFLAVYRDVMTSPALPMEFQSERVRTPLLTMGKGGIGGIGSDSFPRSGNTGDSGDLIKLPFESPVLPGLPLRFALYEADQD